MSDGPQSASDLDLSKVRAHVRKMHPRMPNRRLNRDLAQEHARQHHRYHLGHYHEFDNEGLLAGPNTDRRQPSGWWTGLKVVMRGNLPWPTPSGQRT